jgi:transposase
VLFWRLLRHPQQGTTPRFMTKSPYGWYWAADVLAATGAQVHLAHPLGVKAFAYRRVKNDFRDAADLADLLRPSSGGGCCHLRTRSVPGYSLMNRQVRAARIVQGQ